MKNNLKFKIPITFALLLLIGMILINIVMVSFWNKSLVTKEFQRIHTINEMFFREDSRYQGSSFKNNDLNEFKKLVGKNCLSIEFIIKQENSKNIIEKQIEDIGYGHKKDRKQVHILFFKVPDIKKFLRVTIDTKKELNEIYKYQPMILLYLLLNLIVLVTVGFFRMVKTIIKPIDNLIELSETYHDISLVSFNSYPKGNEFGKLSYSLNNMLCRINEDKKKLEENIADLKTVNRKLIESQSVILRAEKLAAVGRLSAGLAHEIGNPLSIVNGYLELLECDSLNSNERLKYSENAQKEIERINKMVRHLLNYSRKSTPQNCIVSINLVLSDVYDMIKTQPNYENIVFNIDLCDGLNEIKMQYDDLYQILLNFLFNAIDAINDRSVGFLGAISISCRSIVQKKLKPIIILIEIEDNGIGIPDENLTTVFDPFFTTKDVGKGTGLGLTVSHAMIDNIDGKIDIESEINVGTKVSITIPLVQ